MKKLISTISIMLIGSSLLAQTLVIGGKTVKMGPKWTPENIETRAWFDASDTNSITADGFGAVSGWADQSTNNYDVTQLTGSRQPTTGLTTINGLNAIEFDVTHFLRNTSSLFGAGEAYSLAVITYQNSSSNYCAIVDGVGPTSTRGFLNPSSATAVRYLGNDNQGMTATHTRQVGTTLFSVIATGDSGSRLVIDGGATPGTIKIANGMTNGLTVGNNISGGFDMNGAIGELVYSRGAWDVATRQKVEGYLAWKWGARDNLDSSHPYKHVHPQNDAEAKVITP